MITRYLVTLSISLISFLLTALFFIDRALAQNANTPSTRPETFIMYCPPPSSLKKNEVTLTWSANRNLFQSYETSFATHINSFSGAQWVGSNLGQITCVYQTQPAGTFPILLIFHTLTIEPDSQSLQKTQQKYCASNSNAECCPPTQSAWNPNQDGFRNCHSTNPCACPFLIRKKPKEMDVYEEAEQLKSSLNSRPSPQQEGDGS